MELAVNDIHMVNRLSMSFATNGTGGKYISEDAQFVGKDYGASMKSGYFAGRILIGPDDSKDGNNRSANFKLLQPYIACNIWRRTA